MHHRLIRLSAHDQPHFPPPLAASDCCKDQSSRFFLRSPVPGSRMPSKQGRRALQPVRACEPEGSHPHIHVMELRLVGCFQPGYHLRLIHHFLGPPPDQCNGLCAQSCMAQKVVMRSDCASSCLLCYGAHLQPMHTASMAILVTAMCDCNHLPMCGLNHACRTSKGCEHAGHRRQGACAVYRLGMACTAAACITDYPAYQACASCRHSMAFCPCWPG